jgi:1-pyrroline-5-carboxylate dehydrogenase
VRSARQVGRIVHGGTHFRTGPLARGLFVEPAIVTDLPCDHWLNREEVFLPFLSVQPCDRLADALILGNSVNYGLAAGLYREDPDEIELFKTKA